MKRTIVIIGGVAVGASAAARLRRLSEEDEIILLEKDEYISFANCGLPYYIGDEIKERDNLIVQTIDSMATRFNLDIRNFSEAVKIDKENKIVRVLDKCKNEEYDLNYDYVILAPGANPIIPEIEGIKDANNVFKLRNIPDTDLIKNHIGDNKIKSAVIVGGGFIGLEMAENLNHLGIDVTVVDLSNQVMKMFDFEMAKLIQNTMERMGVTFKLNNSIVKFENSGKSVTLKDGSNIDTDIVIMAIGVIPDTKLAQDANLELGVTKAIKVNEYNQTSNEFIYAGGDAIEVEHYISKEPSRIPLAWPANRQGRLIADHINGIKTKYNGTLGSAVIKIFNCVAATTGLNEEAALRAGFLAKSIHVYRGNHAGYYPNASDIALKLIYNADNGVVLGAQAYGQEGTEKRIDVIATSIKFNATIDDLTDIEICYAPPFSSAKDPVNIAGYVAQNVQAGMYKPFYVQDVINLKDKQFIDVRTEMEYKLGTFENAKNIPVDEIRDRLNELDFNQDIYLSCQVGQRGYLAARILKESGFTKCIYNLSGGYKLYKEYIYQGSEKKTKQLDSSENENPQTVCPKTVVKIDACGIQCPGPIIKLKEGIDSLNDGCALDIEASDFGFYEDVKTWTETSGHKLDYVKHENGKVFARVIKTDNGVKISDVQEQRQTIVAFSNDFDKLMATFIIGTGALAMNSKVTIFFTFWGLSALRKENFKEPNKTFLDKMFSLMLPKGINKTGLSKMNMGGLGGKMMRYTMNEKNVETLPSLVKQFMDNGGKIVACTMSMDVMGIKKEELIDGIEYGGVATYIGDAQKSYSNLFI